MITAKSPQPKEFTLAKEPVSYQLCVHLRNMLKSGVRAEIIVRHMTNLELHYGPETVETCVQYFFPNFHAKYYQVDIPKTYKERA